MAVEGRPLYATPPKLWVTNYPFASFHLVGWLGVAIGNVVLAGRVTSFAAMIVLAALVGGAVRTMSGSVRGGIHSGLCLLLWIATFTPERRAMNDPELLGAAVAALGLLAYVKVPASMRWLCLSALAFAVSMFIKQDVLALPLGVGVHLVVARRWKAFVVWAGVGLATACLLLELTFRLDGPCLLANLLQPRAYLAGNLIENTLQYLLHFGAPLALGATLLVQRREMVGRTFLLILLLITGLVSVLLSGGDGVAGNIFYPSMIALAVASGAVVSSLDHSARATKPRRSLVAALVVPVLAGAVFVPFQLDKDLVERRNLPSAAEAAQRTVASLRAADGPAICEDLLLCYEAGKPLDYDPFFVKDQISIGRLKQADLLAMLVSHHYAAIEIDGVAQPRIAARRRFSVAFMRALASEYRLVSDGVYALFEPRDPGGPARPGR